MFAVVLAALLSIATLIGVGFAAGAGPRTSAGGPPARTPAPGPLPSPTSGGAEGGTGLAAPPRPLDPLAWPVVPAIDAALQTRLRAVFLAGRAMGNRAGVFAKIGDSITATNENRCGRANQCPAPTNAAKTVVR